MTTALKISKTLAFPVDAVTETFAILAVKRAGKSNAAVVMAEEMYYAGTGIETLGDNYEPLPTGEALREHWLAKLPEGERRILAELISDYPDGVHGDDLDDRTGYKRSSRNTYLQRLRARELITTSTGAARASDTLFLDGAQ